MRKGEGYCGEGQEQGGPEGQMHPSQSPWRRQQVGLEAGLGEASGVQHLMDCIPGSECLLWHGNGHLLYRVGSGATWRRDWISVCELYFQSSRKGHIRAYVYVF